MRLLVRGLVDPAKIEPTEKCQDDSWRDAVKAFQEVMRIAPNGRYINDARGWLVYLYRRGGERARALAEYYRLLGHPTDWDARLEAKKSLQVIGHESPLNICPFLVRIGAAFTSKVCSSARNW